MWKEVRMSDEEDETVVLVTPTIEDGTVVRWYVHEAAAENCCEYMSASRNGVQVKTYLHKVPEGQLLAAQAAYELMRRDRNADVSDMATHRFKRFMGREIEPIPADPEESAQDRFHDRIERECA